MTPLRATMIHDMQLQRLAPKPQKAYIAAVAGLAKCYGCSPAQLSPHQMRSYLHHLLVERRLAWSSCHQGACGLQCFYVTTLCWDVLHLPLPPRTGRRLLPHLMRGEELQRLCTSAPTPRHRGWLMTTDAAGLRVGEVVRLQLTDIDSDRRCMRVNQGKGRKDRYTLLSTRLLAALRVYWPCYRPSPWLLPAQDRTKPMSMASAQKIYSHTKRRAGITHGHGIHTLRNALT
jgi:integrase/recombinase XerD